LVVGNKAFVSENGIQGDTGVTFAEDKAVPAGLFWIIGVNEQNLMVQDGEDFHNRKARRDVAPAALAYNLKYGLP
jgi:hypothetical protein